MPRSDGPLTLWSSPRLRLSSGIASSCRGWWRVETAKSGRKAEEPKAGNRLRFANFILAFRVAKRTQPQAVAEPGRTGFVGVETTPSCLGSR